MTRPPKTKVAAKDGNRGNWSPLAMEALGIKRIDGGAL